MEHYPILDRIQSPSDLRTLGDWEVGRLCYEIRQFLIEHVSRTGGHLASNLGAVELTVALHRVFDSPKDSIVWDVGHQSYTHKILTGRKDQFSTLRQRNGLSGFPKPEESVHDAFVAGHASISISAAYGIACANKMSGNDRTAVAVVGDGAFTGGMIYEAINNAGRSNVRLVIVLNHNDMSISRNVGAFARYLSTIRAKPGYLHVKQHVESVLDHLPLVGRPLKRALRSSKSILKYILFHNTFFEEMGLEYFGPVDGHNIQELEQVLRRAKALKRPAVVQVETVKGKGYTFAERNPPAYHGVSQFDIQTGSPDGEPAPACNSFSAVFGAEMVKLGQNPKVCAITAAMAVGTGLDPFSKACRSRFFDVGIAEEHAVTFAAGLAVKGFIPVFAVYSTFFQRCFDQVLHDAALERTHIVLAIDRAGIVGDDGDTHQGIFDISLLTAMPGITIYSPATFDQLRSDIRRALFEDTGVVAVRYPRGGENPCHCTLGPEEDDVWLDGTGLTAISYGRTASALYEAVQEMEQPPEVVLLNRIWPFSEELVRVLARRKHILFFEESVQSGSIAEHLLTALVKAGFDGKYEMVTLPDGFIRQCSIPWALQEYGLSAEAIGRKLREASGENAGDNPEEEKGR